MFFLIFKVFGLTSRALRNLLGDKCRFSHAEGDEEKEPCRNFKRGKCAWGDECKYSHAV